MLYTAETWKIGSYQANIIGYRYVYLAESSKEIKEGENLKSEN